MDTLNKTQTQNPTIYVYTQHVSTIKVIEEVCGNGSRIIVLTQDRTRDPVDDVLRQVGTSPAILYAVLPVDKAVELRQRAPQLVVRLLQLDGTIIERTGKPYDPKSEYPIEIVKAALRAMEVKNGAIRYMSFKEMAEVVKRGFKKVGVFNDTMREGLKLALQRLGVNVELVKTCDSNDCIQVNPPGFQSGYRISFPGTAGRLTPEQIAEALLNDAARVYYVEIDAEVVPLCERPES
jgi:hypothetical protein